VPKVDIKRLERAQKRKRRREEEQPRKHALLMKHASAKRYLSGPRELKIKLVKKPLEQARLIALKFSYA